MGWEGFIKEALLFTICGFIVSWAGSYFMNLIQVPPLIHAEQQSEIARLMSEAQQVKDAEAERLRLDFDFRLHTQSTRVPAIKMQITPIQFDFVRMPTVVVTVWNKGQEHIQIFTCRISTESQNSPKVIKSDQRVPPKPGEEAIDVTEPLAELLFPLKRWDAIKESYKVEVEVECKIDAARSLRKSKGYRIETKIIGGMNLDFGILPAEN